MDKQKFIDLIKDGAIKAQEKYGICASLTMAQAILESGWGQYAPGNNMFGIKWQEGCEYGRQLLSTKEFLSGAMRTIKDYFRSYGSLADSLYDHAQFLVQNSRYKNLLGTKNYKTACKLIKEDGYATDPNYTQQLIQLIEENQLYKFDNVQPASQSFIKLDGGGYASYQDKIPGINLIIKDFSSDVVRVFAWVDSDRCASWSFALAVPNANYTLLKKGASKVVVKRNGGYTFSKNSTYKISAKGYDKDSKVVATGTIAIKVPVK
jgi:hypothetical protein